MSKIYTLILLIFFVSCINKTETESENTLKQENIDNTISLKRSESKLLQNKIIAFIDWYAKNLKKLDKIELVNNIPYEIDEVVDTTKFYSVNFENTEKYLTEFRKSGLFSEKYIDNQRVYFRDCEKNFIESPENDGPPAGFDYDLVMKSQDYDDDLIPGHLKVEILEVIKNKATVIAKFNYGNQLKIDLSKENGVWKIDDIRNQIN